MKQLSSHLVSLFAACLSVGSLFVAAPKVHAQNYAAVFYFSGFGDSLYSSGALSPTGDAWIMKGQTPSYSPPGIVSFWGKPLWAATHGDGTIKNNYRFYFNGNPNQPNADLLNWHADLLTRAGIDFVVLDFTNGAADFPNGPSYISGTKALCAQWQARMNAGLPTPKIVFFARNEAALATIETTYFNVYRSDLFFNYLGKKLLLVAKPNDALGEGDAGQPAVPTNGRFANYTARHCWGLNNSGSYWQFKTNTWTPPPPFYYNGQPEQMCVPVGTQASYMTTDGNNPVAGAIGRQNGAYFNTYINAAQQVKPKFTFIHSWNEWHALNVGGSQATPSFVDQWLTEYSSDIEPMAGGHGYQYYDLMAEQVARLKGTFPILSGHTYRIVAAHSGRAMDDNGWSTANGNQMIQWDNWGGPPQQWTAYDLGGGYWRFVNAYSGKSLEVGGYSTVNGGAVQQWDWLGHNWQQWSLRPVGNGQWNIVNRGSGLFMDVSGGPGATGNGALIHQWNSTGGTNQQWSFQFVN